MDNFQLLISCEHAGNIVPSEYLMLLEKEKEVLNTHEGLDIGAKELTLYLGNKLNAPIYFSEISRLLVEANRSTGNPSLFSRFTNNLPDIKKREIISKYYEPYRNSVEAKIRELILNKESVIHLSIHTFTPELNGAKRTADIGLLYDPSRRVEVGFCNLVERYFNESKPEIVIKHNYPYLGTDDGFVTHLRNQFPKNSYSGIELEVNQKFPIIEIAKWEILKKNLADAIIKAVSDLKKNYAK